MYRQSINQIKKSASRAETLTRQLLAFSRKEVIQPKVLDINKLIEDMKKLLGRLLREDVELATLLNPEIGFIKADPGQVEQVIMNLTVNARDAMSKGGRLSIETRNMDLKKSFVWDGLEIKSGLYSLLIISDTGTGMDKETQDHIFEPFFTTKEAGKGTGLGLATVYGVVQQNKGYINVKSEIGKGSVFEIYFPCVKETVAKKKETAHTEHYLRGSETILVVEDEDVVRELVCQVLRRQGYHVIRVQHGGSALLKSEQYMDNIHLILSDIVMSEMNGPELVKRLKVHHPEMKILYMSGYLDDEIVRHGILEEDVQFIQKPFSPVSLLKKVREVLEME